MRSLFASAAFLFLLIQTGLAPAADNPFTSKPPTAAGPADLLVAKRDKINLNADWRFLKGDTTGAEAIGYSDAAWAKVSLPHVFDTPYYALKKGTFWYVGYGWYRKHFNVQAKWKESSRIFLEFEAAFQVAQVYVNGKLMGEHKGGFTGFYFDITNAVQAGRQCYCGAGE